MGRDLDFWPPVARLIRASVQASFLNICEESLKAVKVFHGERVIFVIMAFTATQRRAQPCPTEISDPLRDVFGQILLGLDAALGTHHAKPVVA